MSKKSKSKNKSSKKKTPQPKKEPSAGAPPKKEKIYLLTQSQLDGIVNTYRESTFPANAIFRALGVLLNLPVFYDPDEGPESGAKPLADLAAHKKGAK